MLKRVEMIAYNAIYLPSLCNTGCHGDLNLKMPLLRNMHVTLRGKLLMTLCEKKNFITLIMSTLSQTVL